MLSNHCGRKWSSRKYVPRQPTYSSLSRYRRSTFRQTDDRQNSTSVSDDNQRLTAARATNTTDLNGLNERMDQEQQNRSSTRVKKVNNREFGRSISRGSNSSQLTVMTSISKSFNEGNNNMAAICVNECLFKIQKPSKAVTLGE